MTKQLLVLQNDTFDGYNAGDVLSCYVLVEDYDNNRYLAYFPKSENKRFGVSYIEICEKQDDGYLHSVQDGVANWANVSDRDAKRIDGLMSLCFENKESHETKS